MFTTYITTINILKVIHSSIHLYIRWLIQPGHGGTCPKPQGDYNLDGVTKHWTSNFKCDVCHKGKMPLGPNKELSAQRITFQFLK